MRTEVRRGRKFVEYHDPDTQPEGTFTQEISAHDVSYQDEAGSWRQLVEDWEADGADGFSFRASRMNHKVRFDSIGAWRWYPRRNVETEYLVLNRPQCWLTATKRWGNLLVNGISREGKDITLTSVRNVTRVIHSRWSGIKTDWILLNANAPTRFRQKIDLVGITEIEGVLFGADGERLGQLMPTTATDANGAELPCTGSYVNGYVEFQADVTGAVFPVTVDPDFASASMFGYIRGNSATFATAKSTSSGSDTSSLRAGMISGDRIFRGYVKFDTSSISDDATIAQVNFKAALSYIDTDPSATIVLSKYDWHSDSYPDFPLQLERERLYDGALAATVDGTWITTGGKSINTYYTSDNLDTTWVNKTGVTYYALLDQTHDINATDWTTGAGYQTLYPPGDATYPPVLIVTYTAGGALLRVNMNGNMQSLSGGFHG